MSYVCTYFNTEENWLFGPEYHITRIFNSISDNNAVTIGADEGRWIHEVGNHNLNISTTFSLITGPDIGKIYSSP